MMGDPFSRQTRPTAVRGGFTMIELLIGTALAALLMVGVMRVATTLTRGDDRAALNRLDADQAVEAALKMIAWDVANGRFGAAQGADPLSDSPSGLSLAGMGLLDTGRAGIDGERPRAADPLLAPGVVRYAVVESGGTACLVRRQQGALTDGTPGFPGQLVLTGVTVFEVRPVGKAPRPQTPSPQTRREPAAPEVAGSRPAAKPRGKTPPPAELAPWKEPVDPFLQTQGETLRPLPRVFRVRIAVEGARPREVLLETGVVL